MMQSENFEPSWQLYSAMNTTFDQIDHCDFIDSPMDGSDFLSSITETESSPVFPIHDFSQGIMELELDLPVGFESIWSDEIESLYSCLEQSEVPSSQDLSSGGAESVWSPSPSMKSSTEPYCGLDFPGEDMEVDTQVSILHLLRAYGGAMEEEQPELRDVISRCLSEKASPVGASLERLAHNMIQETEQQRDYMRQESCKNYEAAFNAFYQIFPYGRFAHFSANSAILEAVPRDVEAVHVVDFDLGQGVQWPAVIASIARQQKTMRLTSIKFEEELDDDDAPWRFEDTKRRLVGYARSVGLKLKMEEIKIEDLASEIKKSKKRGGRKEWVAFNCMVGLPHMGKGRSRALAMEFLKAAKELKANSLTIGDGDGNVNLRNCNSSFGSFFDGCLVHYQALLESMEMSFPEKLGEARLGMESLFVGPQICSNEWMQRWEEVIREGCCDMSGELGMEGWGVSRESLMEAKEMVRNGEGLFGVRVGEEQNEMVLEWRGTPLVTVSAWRN